MKSLSVVLPCHNEEHAVLPVLNRLLSLSVLWDESKADLVQIVVVDDGSTDGTQAVLQQWKAGHQETLSEMGAKLTILRNEQRLGYGAALKSGIEASEGSYIAFYDVDGTYDPELLPEMIAQLDSKRAEMVCGDRLSNCEHMPLTREIGNRLFVATINFLYRTRVYDSCTGMRVFTRGMRDFFASRSLPNGLDYSLAMTLSFLRTGHQLVEVPIPYARRIGYSKLRVLYDGPRFFMRILASWVHTPPDLRRLANERKRLLESAVVTKKR